MALGCITVDWTRIALGVTIFVSIVAGLSTFYFTKSFGTFTDYLTVIVVGGPNPEVEVCIDQIDATRPRPD